MNKNLSKFYVYSIYIQRNVELYKVQHFFESNLDNNCNNVQWHMIQFEMLIINIF